ncbi:MAG: PAS domain S-box protein [Marinosulfonomonas sp.]|nr:PAS domain S-box protein [Marinosulfonomonas sp.]
MNNPTDDKALLHAILDATVDSIILSDETGTIIRVNTTACTMFGYSESELIGQNVKIIMPAEYAIAHDGYMKTHLETGEHKIIGKGRDLEGQIKDGKTFPLHLSVGRTEIGGKPVFVSILHDLTQRKAAQAALARSQRLDAIGQMTGGVAHDFNNLLTVVIGNLELLEMRGVGANQRALIRDALDAAQLGADLTSRLMIFARKSNLAPIRSDLREVCEDALAILKRTLGSPFIIKIDFADDLKPVMIDPVQFQSALMNLALNARDAMGDKGELLISVTNVSIDDSYMAQEIDIKPGEYVRLSVSDDGDGMSPETQKHAFEPFFTTKTDSGGTGLGLAMVHGFVRQSGGHVTLYSEPGLGTSIGLYFPALSQSAEALPDTAPKSIVPGRRALGRGETVLVVEDNPKVRKLTVERIRDLGFDVEAAENGEDAYAMLKSGVQADILFSDLVMPGALNGYDLAAKVNAEYPNVKVLLTSGYASDVVTSGMAHDRLYDILHKPYRQSDLANRLQALLAEDSDG